MPYHFLAIEFGADHLARCLKVLGGEDFSRSAKVAFHTFRPTTLRVQRLEPGNLPTSNLPGNAPRGWLIVPADTARSVVTEDLYGFDSPYFPSLAALETYLAALAEKHAWAISPWGGFLTDEAFALITRSDALRDLIVKATRHPGTLRLQHRRVADADYLAANHTIEYTLAATATHALIQENHSTRGKRLWTHIVAPGQTIYATARLRGEPDANRELAAALSSFDNPDLESANWLYRLDNSDAFASFARKCYEYSDGVRGLVLPGELPLSTALTLARQWHGPLADRLLRARISPLLNASPWAYTMYDCFWEVHYDRFSTRIPALMQRFLTHIGPELVTLF